MPDPTTPIAARAALRAAFASGHPFAVLHREGRDHLELFAGDLSTVPTLAELPLPPGPGPRTLAVVPYRQVRERGFACVDDQAPVECLRITAHHRIPYPDALTALPAAPVQATAGGFDVGDEAYGRMVDAVLREEIGRGAGANFVIHRSYTAQLGGEPLAAAGSALHHLLRHERGAYWTFLVHTGERTLVGATPERHVSVEDGLVTMNPISGTLRHPGAAGREALLRFLADPKEINELYMVLDEELKMMARVADLGGQVVGPYLKEMAHLVHTEYLLAGKTTVDVREVLRETMFAPTVTGSPIENACRVIARHERRGRGRYAGVLALLGHDRAGRQALDAPILIRFAEIDRAGRLRVPVGATLVRDSTPAGEVAETHTKAAAVLAALGLRSGPDPAPAAVPVPSVTAPAPPAAALGGFADDVRVRAALAARNDHLARFWLEQREQPVPGPATALIVDGEDTFTGMLVHLLRALGLRTTLRSWSRIADPTAAGLDRFDLVVAGPGPGDPTDPADPKLVTLRRLVRHLLERRRPMLALCLGHQLLAGRLGLTLHGRALPYQGLQREIDLFGTRRRVGYYASFTAVAAEDRIETRYGPVRLCRDPADRSVHALVGETFAGVQFHPESVLTEHGLEILTELLTPLVPGLPSPADLAVAHGSYQDVPGVTTCTSARSPRRAAKETRP